MKIESFSLLLISFAFILWSCQSNKESDDVKFDSTADSVYRQALSTLASDDFLGRMPFTEGEAKTLSYLEEAFDTVGLEPGNGDSYFQDVPMVESTSRFEDDKVTLENDDASLELQALEEIVGGTRRVVESQEIEKDSLVFAGFGINAPEYDWNDYEGLDVEGKIVIVMVNDPGFYDPDLFRGKNMTYYGRWTYKYEEAAKQGAAGVLIIHDKAPASYGWGVVRSSNSGAQLSLSNPNAKEDYPGLEGWISGEAAEEMFDFAGIKDAEALMEEAKNPGFEGSILPVTLSATIHNAIKEKSSKNVIGVLPGTDKEDEYVFYSAHWDHFGIGEPIEGDSIYNGAADNASGVAALLTLAHKFKENPKPERSIVFFSPTSEEQGLLGSEYYAENPIYPLKNTVVDINFDILQPFGKMEDIFIVGKGQSEVDPYLEDAAKVNEREVRAEEDPSDGWYYRSDHFSFAKVGVPVLYIANGVKSVEHGEEWGKKQKKDYFDNRYHKPQDNYSPSWDTSGTLADLKLVYIAGRAMANTDDFPQWHDGVLYKKAREKQE